MEQAIREVCSRCLIVCYKEDTSKLEAEMANSGFKVTALRGAYSPDEMHRPAAIRTLMNHRNAWQAAAQSEGYTLICEADFVPCRDIGSLPVFWPTENPRAWGYLYQGAPRLLSIVGKDRHLRAHCAPTVAYIVNATVAPLLLRYYEDVTARLGVDTYYNWETFLQWETMSYGAEAYMPLRHYGEHGGNPNPEHTGIVVRAGRHRADNLVRPLAFLPEYARGSRLRFWAERIEARLLGLARLATGRWIVDTNVYARNFSKTVAMQLIGVRRILR